MQPRRDWPPFSDSGMGSGHLGAGNSPTAAVGSTETDTDDSGSAEPQTPEPETPG